jgi:hypothetical protein
MKTNVFHVYQIFYSKILVFKVVNLKATILILLQFSVKNVIIVARLVQEQAKIIV